MSLLVILRRHEGTVFPPAGIDQLVQLVRRSRAELGMDLPDEYMAFLRDTDGALANGLIFYPSESRRWPGIEVPGIVDINLSRRRYRKGLAGLTVLAEFDDDFLVHNPADGFFLRLDRLSLDPLEKSPTLLQLAGNLLIRLG